jgi:uncharacterized protein (UPF0276 family)
MQNNLIPTSLASTGHGFGLGLRTLHYPDFLATKQPVDWLEIITDNFLVEGGKPLRLLETFRGDYPMVMHGVAMSIGASAGVDLAYLGRVKALADRIEPLWVSDHLCWIGTDTHQLHDLYPLPYTDEAANHVITQIRRCQDVLQRRLVLENVSSYLDFKQSTASEWQFLSHVAQEADCLLLVDVNNIFVSSVNHGFDALTYLQALPAQRVQQIHLAGHSNAGDHLIDTHDHPVDPAVWALYAKALQLFGSVPTMIERDAHIPALPVLLEELEHARQLAHSEGQVSPKNYSSSLTVLPATEKSEVLLVQMQETLASYVLDFTSNEEGSNISKLNSLALVKNTEPVSPIRRLGIYHHAYRARLSEVLADTFAKTYLFMGSDAFNLHAVQYAVTYPPLSRSLNRYGENFPAFLNNLYPQNSELHELAQLDWDLRVCFDGPNFPALNVAQAQADSTQNWLNQTPLLHPSVLLRALHTNVVALWKAIDEDAVVPPAIRQTTPSILMVWRHQERPCFQTLSAEAALLMQSLAAGLSINQACTQLEKRDQAPPAENLSLWLRTWLEEGIFLNLFSTGDST